MTVAAIEGTTVRQLLNTVDLNLRLLAGGQFGGRHIHGSHVTDLRHPARYLLPGEIVLTNGLWLDRVSPSEWVQEVAVVGTAALGFGLSHEQRSIPRSLISACEDGRLPLLEIPEDISFSEIANRIWAHGSERAILARRQLDQHRRVRQLVRDGVDQASLVAFLHRETGFALGLYRLDGTPVAAFGDRAPAAVISAATRLALGQSLPCDVVEGYSAFDLPGTNIGSLLVVQRPLINMADEDRTIVEQVATLLAIRDEHERTERRRRSFALSDLLDSIWSAEITDSHLRYRLSVLGVDPNSDHLVVVTPLSPERLDEVINTCDAKWVAASLDRWSVALIPTDSVDNLESVHSALQSLGYNGPLGVALAAQGAVGFRRGLLRGVSECLLHDAGDGRTRRSYETLLAMVPPEIRLSLCRCRS